MAPFRVLVIPGQSVALDLLSELVALASISTQNDQLLIEILPPAEASELRLARKLTGETDHYDGLHFLGHADSDAFTLANGDRLTGTRLLQLCTDARAKFVFLNACTTAKLAQYLVNRKLAAAVAYATEVLDRDAILAAVRFYNALARAHDPFRDGLRTAYQAAAPDDGTLLWLTNGQYIQEIIAPIIARLDALTTSTTTSFTSYGTKLDSLRQEIKQHLQHFIHHQQRLTTAIKVTALILVLSALAISRAAGVFSRSPLQTIPPPSPTPAATTAPAAPPPLLGCEAPDGDQENCTPPSAPTPAPPSVATETAPIEVTLTTPVEVTAPPATSTPLLIASATAAAPPPTATTTMTPPLIPSAPPVKVTAAEPIQATATAAVIATGTEPATATATTPTEVPPTQTQPAPTADSFDRAVATAVAATVSALDCAATP